MSDGRSVQAIVFDLDGVLVDSEPVHALAMNRLIAPHVLTDQIAEALVGTTVIETMDIVKRGLGLPDPVEELAARYADIVTDVLRSSDLEPLDGATDLLNLAATRGLGLAIGSQSPRPWIEATLEGCGFAGRFETIVSSTDVARGKPAPDIYLRAAELLEVPPSRCIAIEDSAPGVQSACAAGMTVIHLRQTATAAEPQEAAHVVLASLRDFEAGWLDDPPSG